jgi:hypothetical protein
MSDFYFAKEVQIAEFPKYVGGYRIGGNGAYYTQFNLTRKPIWLHRVMVRLLLGWEWIDGEKT